MSSSSGVATSVSELLHPCYFTLLLLYVDYDHPLLVNFRDSVIEYDDKSSLTTLILLYLTYCFQAIASRLFILPFSQLVFCVQSQTASLLLPSLLDIFSTVCSDYFGAVACNNTDCSSLRCIFCCLFLMFTVSSIS